MLLSKNNTYRPSGKCIMDKVMNFSLSSNWANTINYKLEGHRQVIIHEEKFNRVAPEFH
jgi:hypothetical protein